MSDHPQPGTVVAFMRCGTRQTATVIGPDAPPIGRRGEPTVFSEPRYLARATVNRMVVAFTLSEVVA